MPNQNTEIRDRAAATIMEMLRSNPSGCTIQDFATATGVSVATVRRVLVPLVEDQTIRSFRDPYGTQWLRYQLSTNVAPISRRRNRKK